MSHRKSSSLPTLCPLEFGVAGWLRGHQDGGPLGAVTDDVPEKDLDERVPELFAHGTVQYKVDSVVEQRQSVHHVSQRPVDVIEEAIHLSLIHI